MSETRTTVVQQFEDGTQVPQPGFDAFSGGGGGGVTSFNTRTGDVTLTGTDVSNAGASENFAVGGATSLDAGAITTDGDGNMVIEGTLTNTNGITSNGAIEGGTLSADNGANGTFNAITSITVTNGIITAITGTT